MRKVTIWIGKISLSGEKYSFFSFEKEEIESYFKTLQKVNPDQNIPLTIDSIETEIPEDDDRHASEVYDALMADDPNEFDYDGFMAMLDEDK